MLRQLIQPKHKNSLITHVSKLSKGDGPSPIGSNPLKFSSMGNSLPKSLARSKEFCSNDSQRVLPILKKEQIQLIMQTEPSRDEDIQRLIEMLISRRIKNTRLEQDDILKQTMVNSTCLRMYSNNILQDLHKKGRLGTDLKGINKKILTQIQCQLGDVIDKELKLFENRTAFNDQCQKMSEQLSEYKVKILESIDKIRNRQ